MGKTKIIKVQNTTLFLRTRGTFFLKAYSHISITDWCMAKSAVFGQDVFNTHE